MSEGYVYILKNEAMPGYVKIGFTQQDDVQSRLKQLYTTGVPLPFECVYSARVPDCRKLERTLHFVFDDQRPRANREFFQTNPDLARAIIDLVAIETTSFTDEEQQITPEERGAIEAVKTRAEALTFARLGLKPGDVLTFTKDAGITCRVADTRKVEFKGQIMSLSAAAKSALEDLDYQWAAVRGAEYWSFNGVKLSAMETIPGSDIDSSGM